MPLDEDEMDEFEEEEAEITREQAGQLINELKDEFWDDEKDDEDWGDKKYWAEAKGEKDWGDAKKVIDKAELKARRGIDPREARFEAAMADIEAAVDAGRITKEQADARIGGLKRRIFAAEKQSNRADSSSEERSRHRWQNLAYHKEIQGFGSRACE